MKEKRKSAGLPPGSVVFTGSQKVEKISIHYLQYDADFLAEKNFSNQTKITFHQSAPERIDWYDIRGLHDTELIETIGKTFDVHPLVLEDIVDVEQRPKFEEYEKGIFIIIRALAFDQVNEVINTEQIGIFFRKGLVLTFQETESDLFLLARQRVQRGRGRIRGRGADYLVYALLDVIVDHYFVMLEKVDDVIESLEHELLQRTDNGIRERMHHLKIALLAARKSIAPLREAISRFAKSENELIEDSSTVFIRDLYDHTIQIMDLVESHRDTLNGLQDLHLSEISFRMNQVMQVLTIITTIFVPLSFLAGLYGMNFDNIPELHYKYGYFVLVAFMFVIAGGLLLWFRSKKWL